MENQLPEEVGLSPQQLYQRRLVQKSHDYDAIMEKYNEKCQEVEKLKSQVIAEDPKESLLNPEELRTYRNLKTLQDTEESVNLLLFAERKGKIDTEFLEECAHEDSPLYSNVAKRWYNTELKPRLTEIEEQLESKENELDNLREEIKNGKQELQQEQKEFETVRKNVKKEQLKLDAIDSKSTAIDDITDWIRKFYAGILGIRPNDDHFRNSLFKIEDQLHVLGLFGICNHCRSKLEAKGKWPT